MNDTRDYGIALLRVTLGGLILTHGLVKLFVFTPAGTVGFFASLGLPAIAAYATMALELGGGIALIAGLFVRPIALLQAVLLLGTIVTVHGANGFSFAAKGGGWEYPAFWAVALVVLALTGPGALALRFGQPQTAPAAA
ncbi:MAG: DoxX family protein [Alphaproteobacteria bacterium]|nr:DoxX family protein [Alphaproteobacteria bacterium]